MQCPKCGATMSHPAETPDENFRCLSCGYNPADESKQPVVKDPDYAVEDEAEPEELDLGD